ncbi:nicotinate-nucleotide adenylyltransferase [Paenibacillus sp. LHD-117]|uniref:nicotinate-nucleotide adenylyltransferase n=1 Tax=Paenibacillus sp. LHD-117 TaxID=3071412 RepID=UPI0027DFF68F|nr:nicotinate-nucleotide adenylyltransferase [Paenibacillus sp. LHD-117]MDQ6419052.1 nicotinate-nucleotide adenylyltransferase [Paenibacillus sp. LHD-117]
MRVGIMGGTFDPIHIGHLIAAETALEACGLDEVWFIPTATPPLKEHAPGERADDRLEMVSAAIAGHDRFRVLDIELRRGGVSYSIDTVKSLRELYPDHSFAYIIGSDRINDLPEWHSIGELAELVTFIGLARPGTEARPGLLPDELRCRLTFADMPAIGISSTDLRERLSQGGSIRYLVPDAVYAMIRRHGWYGSTTDDR